MTSISIRNGHADDIATLIELEHDAGELFRSIGYDFCADGPARDANEHMRGINHGALLVAQADKNQIAGFALLWPADDHAHLTELSVERKFQGHGIGTKLVEACQIWARENGYEAITLTSFRDVPWNAPFYARLGFEIFEPTAAQPELVAIIGDESNNGFAQKPRVAMIKKLAK